MRRFLLLTAAAAAAKYLFDPTRGAGRRAKVRDRLLASVRRRGQQVAGAGRAAGAEAQGASQQLRHQPEEPKAYDDVTLAQKVESEIFRDTDAKGAVAVNAQDGVVQLRGEVERSELIDELVEKARKVQGVRGVESLLHLPGTPAPMHQ